MKLVRFQKAKRKQIYLDPFQDEGVTNIAARDQVSQSEVIRQALDGYLRRRGVRRRTASEFFEELSRGTEKLKIPRDISSRHEHYLYGKGSDHFK